MEKLIDIFNELNLDVDFMTCENLVDGRYLDSLTILSLITELEDTFDIEIPTVEIIPANFNSIKNIWALITRLKG